MASGTRSKNPELDSLLSERELRKAERAKQQSREKKQELRRIAAAVVGDGPPSRKIIAEMEEEPASRSAGGTRSSSTTTSSRSTPDGAGFDVGQNPRGSPLALGRASSTPKKTVPVQRPLQVKERISSDPYNLQRELLDAATNRARSAAADEARTSEVVRSTAGARSAVSLPNTQLFFRNDGPFRPVSAGARVAPLAGGLQPGYEMGEPPSPPLGTVSMPTTPGPGLLLNNNKTNQYFVLGADYLQSPYENNPYLQLQPSPQQIDAHQRALVNRAEQERIMQFNEQKRIEDATKAAREEMERQSMALIAEKNAAVARRQEMISNKMIAEMEEAGYDTSDIRERINETRRQATERTQRNRDSLLNSFSMLLKEQEGQKTLPPPFTQNAVLNVTQENVARNAIVASKERQERERAFLLEQSQMIREDQLRQQAKDRFRREQEQTLRQSLESHRRQLEEQLNFGFFADEHRTQATPRGHLLGSQDSVNSTNEGLMRPFRQVGKVLNNLNDPVRRDDIELLNENQRSLEKLTKNSIEASLLKSLQPNNAAIQTIVTNTIGAMMGTLESKILNTVDQNIGSRVKRMEQNEKVNSKLHTQKKDEVRPNVMYAAEPGANPDDFRKALAACNNAVRIIERSLTFNSDKFNFLFLLARESNKIAQNFGLSKLQQFNLIFSVIPPGETSEFLHLIAKNNLGELFKIISTYATHAATKQAIEKKINSWRLPNSSAQEINEALVTLLNLLDKNRDGYGYVEADMELLFKEAVKTIIAQNPPLPRGVIDALDASRSTVQYNDPPSEILKVLSAACHRNVGMKTKFQVKAIQEQKQDNTQQFKALTYQPEAANTGAKPKQRYENKKNGGANLQKQSQPQQKPKQPQQSYQNPQRQQPQQKQKQPQNQQNQQKQRQDGQQSGKTWSKRPSKFVEPWPENKRYLSKNGNAVTNDFEIHFSKHCHKCGHSSHQAATCMIYPESTTILTLCTRCRQGLHETCRSRRPGLDDVDPMSHPHVKKIVQECFLMCQQELMPKHSNPGQMTPTITPCDDDSD